LNIQTDLETAQNISFIRKKVAIVWSNLLLMY